MKTLLILRHAKSSWDNVYLSDYERPLNNRGKADAPKMGKLLRREELTPELIISSSAKRAMATAESAALASDYAYDNEIVFTRDLYHADPESYIDALIGVDNHIERVMVVGHNPGIAELVEQLSGVWERMPTAALAQIQLPIDRWDELSMDTQGNLVNVWVPKELAD